MTWQFGFHSSEPTMHACEDRGLDLGLISIDLCPCMPQNSTLSAACPPKNAICRIRDWKWWRVCLRARRERESVCVGVLGGVCVRVRWGVCAGLLVGGGGGGCVCVCRVSIVQKMHFNVFPLLEPKL